MAQNYDLEQNGQEVQNRINQVPINTQDLATEVQARIDGDAAVTQECKGYTDVEINRAQFVEASLQQQINDIVSGDATVSLTASPSAIFAGGMSNINLTATTNKTASEIVIKKDGMVIATGSGLS